MKRFNSIVVRLKEGWRRLVSVSVSLFQFHSGSIKSLTTTNYKLIETMFQFHSGSIKREDVRDVLNSAFNCFNSIVVRLKVLLWGWIEQYNRGFNSIVVRLKVAARIWLGFNRKCFNSIVVRLKAAATAFALRGDILFQFHSGSIKSPMEIGVGGRWAMVSIP